MDPLTITTAVTGLLSFPHRRATSITNSHAMNDMPTLLEVLLGENHHPVKSRSDLVKALEDSGRQKDKPTIILCRSDTLPNDMLNVLYNTVPQLNRFGIKRTEFPGNIRSFDASNPLTGCYIKPLECSCCSTAVSKCAWRCWEVQSSHYEENVAPERQESSTSLTYETTSPPEIVFRLSRRRKNAHWKHARDEATNKSSKTPQYDEHVFTPKRRKFILLSNHTEGRRFIFTNELFLDDNRRSPNSLRDILSLDQICKEWGNILSYCTQQLNNARAIITDRNKDPEDLLDNIAEVTDIVYQLEIIHQDQCQWMSSLKHLSWNEPESSDNPDVLERMETIGKDISNKMDVSFQRASNIMSIYEAFKAREQGASMRRLSWVTFIFLPLLFVASLYGMNVDILQKSPPPWTTYFYLAVPVFILVMASVVIIKFKRKIKGSCLFVIDYGRKVTKLFEKTRICDEEHGGEPVSLVLQRRNNAPTSIQQLCDAIKAGDTDKAESQIIPDLPVDNAIDDDWTALQLAAFHGQTRIVEKLLQHGADVNVSRNKEEGIKTALQAAAGAGHVEIVNRLLAVEADVNAKPASYRGRTALQGAAEGGHIDIVNRLLEAKADVNAEPAEFDGRTALQGAAKSGHIDVVNRLLEAKADVNAAPAPAFGRTSLQVAAGSGHLDIVNRLLEAKADVNAAPTPRFGRTALQAAAESGHLSVVNRLLEVEADVNTAPAPKFGRTALQAAAESGHLSVVNRLLEAKADVNAAPAPAFGRTSLQVAAGSGHLDIVNRLLEAKADVNAAPAPTTGRTALQAAAESGRFDVVNRLLDTGADVNAGPAPKFGRTALQAAAESGHLDIVNRLLEGKADVNAAPAPATGRTALQAAVGSGHLSVVNRLLEAKADVNAAPAPAFGRTALQSAAESGRFDVVNRLLDAGADVNFIPQNIRASKWISPLRLAEENGHVEVANLLRAHGAKEEN